MEEFLSDTVESRVCETGVQTDVDGQIKSTLFLAACLGQYI